MRRLLEVNHNLRQLLRHALAGTQVERHPGPTPVADIGAQGHEGFGVALGIGVFFLQVTGHGLAFAVTGDVLASHYLSRQALAADRRQCLEYLDLLVANAVGRQVAGRVHGNQAEQLQQVVLDHVTQLPGLVEIAPAPFDPDFLGHGDFHVGDGVLVPLGFKQAVGKAQGDQVLNGFLAQVMVDPVDPVFGKILRHRIIDPPRRRQVMADRLLQNRPGTFGQAYFGQVFADRAVHRCRRGEIGDQLFVAANALGQGDKVGQLEKVHMHITQPIKKAPQRYSFQLVLRHEIAQVFFDSRQMLPDLPRLARQRQDARIGMQQVGTVELVQRREKLAQRQVTQGAKQGEGTGFDGYRWHDVCSFIKLR
ncbi:hypothetical protein D3C76_256860 [compost metagenome]